MKLITPDAVSFRAAITEEELRARLAQELLEAIGACGPDGKPLPGVTTRIVRGDSRRGGYVVEATGPAPARLRIPEASA